MEPAKKMTLAEYLDRPEGSEKLEWINGEAYAMAGGSPQHNVTCVNVSAQLREGLQGRPCVVASSDQRIRVEETASYVYPDAVVICPPWQMSANDPMSVTNPTVIVEVTSTTDLHDNFGAKLGHYRQMPSVHHVVFVDAATRTVTRVSRDDDGWRLHDFTEGTVSLDAIGVTLSLDAVFADLDGLPDA